MPNFNIVKKTEIDKTFRVAKICDEYDLDTNTIIESFEGEIVFPKQWQIGLIVGGSGTGKTTIAKDFLKDFEICDFKYTKKSVIDDMPKAEFNDIAKTFYSVGFGSVMSWLKPYEVLSNGEKMRVDLARAILEKDTFCFDEFTSVIDRQIAKTACIALNKGLKKTKKQAVFISCHFDVIEYLQPDWVFDTNKMSMVFTIAHDHNKDLKSKDVGEKSGQSLASIII